ncbi:MAG TPA: 9-O-acetylesterase [Planctomycetaceae bacterium]|nr:9-O-acetylesterase [Planctomycetaceae bacterium]
MRSFRSIQAGVFALAALLAVVAGPQRVSADVRLASVFGNHMVLQREQPVKVWGWADAGERVQVTLGAGKASAEAGADGRWSVELPALQASATPVVFQVEGRNRIELTDVLVGEVWLCSGQSNMEWTVAISANAAAEIAAADYPAIRHIKVPLVAAPTARDTFDGQWQVCSPQTAAGFTACGYYMARKLHQELNVPIGLVNSSWGGTRIEPWTPPIGFQQVPALADIAQSVTGRTPGTPQYQSRLQAHLEATEAWLKVAREGLQSGQQVAPSPAFPAELAPFEGNAAPTVLYNGMIHMLAGFGIRGAIWYQGESNHTEGMLYLEKMKALVGGWRALWGREFPFYYVQIAPFNYGSQDPTVLAQFWEAQAAAQQAIPHSGMVVINDIATLNDIHPPNKQDVGQRLALWALKHDYGREELVAAGPEAERLESADGVLKVHFRNAAGGLKSRDGKPLSHFEIIGPGSGGFHPAEAVIEGPSTVVLRSAKVAQPTAVRFAWHLLAEPNLSGGTGLPTGAFRLGEVPSFLSGLSISKEYRLVYDYDLARLGAAPAPTADHSADIAAFDRVAYLLELTEGSGKMQNVFVSLDAFTKQPKQLGIPTFASAAFFQQPVSGLEIFTDVPGLQAGKSARGQMEFWPHNYAMENTANVPGAAGNVYDSGDSTAPPEDGYGSMQIHNLESGQTVFAVNHWRAGDRADIGIGNNPNGPQDWTFSGNAGSWSSKRLRVYVREVAKK